MKSDEKFLKDFFGPKADINEYRAAIKRHETDRFRPLCNFLKGKIANTEEKNTELLAWLIDYPSRPYRAGWRAPRKDESKPPIHGPKDKEENNSPLPPPPTAPLPPAAPTSTGKQTDQVDSSLAKNIFSKQKVILLFALIMVSTVGSAIYFRPKPKECMYWTGDRYIPVSCDAQIFNKTIIALDTMKVAHFKRITRPDTITFKALGFVWYSKINNKVEFFTADGVNPEHSKKELKRATKYMIKKYAIQNH
ncbi:hypothetical protein [Arcticibacter sp. MXS-1]|uniref:hypothetical protein n=1 Tax=Arcticibacter sp. MXS-1 TaxID=3341726 RepID=UPI0035A8A3EC